MRVDHESSGYRIVRGLTAFRSSISGKASEKAISGPMMSSVFLTNRRLRHRA